jgi:hypothetical protein
MISVDASADWQAFAIRAGSTSPPVILDNTAYGVPAKEFVIAEGGQKAAWGSSSLDGVKLGEIARLKVIRLDDRTRFAAGSGPYVAPYFNIWITDGSGKFAVIANEPSDAVFQALYQNGYDLSWADLANKVAKVYETSDKSWLPNNGVGLTFADLANFRIQAPTVAQLANGWSGLGTGAPRELGTNKAYGVNWIFGETLSNYVSGNSGYVVTDPAANTFVTTDYLVYPQMLAAGKPEFSAPHGTGSNPFAYDWDSAAPQTAAGAPNGYGLSSFSASVDQGGATQADRYRTLRIGLRDLFDGNVAIEQIAKISYYTKKPAPQTAIDWRVSIYTTWDPAGGNVSSWYRTRIQSYPAGSVNLNAPADTWNLWTTAGAANELRFFANRTGFEAGDIAFSELASGPVTRGASTWDFSGEEAMMIDLTLGANSGGGTGQSQMDGVKIELVDGRTADIDLASYTNVLRLDVLPASVYVKPSETVVVDLNVAGLQQPVTALQAMLGFSSTYFQAGAGQVSVAPGGGVWNDLIWNVWTTSGDLDVAVGIHYDNFSAGTTADAKTAIITLTPTGLEGTTRMVFRPDVDPDPGLTKSTYLSDTAAQPVWPIKIDSVDIVIDGTPPVVTCPADVVVSTDPGECHATNVMIGTATATDNLAGVASITSNAPAVYPKGVTTVTWTATDRADNVSTCTQTVTVNDTEAPVVVCPSDITVSADPGVCQATLQFEEPFDTAPTLSATQAPGAWYTDRYAPAGFTSVNFGGRNCLKHSISSADSSSLRPSGYNSAFYNTQGRKFDVNMNVPSTIRADLYIPADWATHARRADLWATIMDSDGAVNGYPIAGFICNDPVDPFNSNPANPLPRFRVWADEGSGGWMELGLPAGFAYDQWYTIQVEFTPAQYVYSIVGPAGVSTLTYTYPRTGEVLRVANVMLQAYNFSDATYPVGDSYDVYWDDVTVGPQGPVATDNCQVASVTCARSDALTLSDPFPVGLTVVTWTVTDTSGNVTTCTQNVTVVDDQDPSVLITSATQAETELLGTTAVAVQGGVQITVTATDNCGIAQAPAVTVTDAASVATVLTASGSGPWTYTYSITPATANGIATISATVQDIHGNTATDTDTFTINKNQVAGQVELQGFVGSSRAVTFVATGGTVKTWTQTLSFVGTTASYTLTDVPAGTTGVSAKTAWSLRNKLAVTLDSDGQAAAGFTGGEMLLGGDLNGSNSINVLDYSVLKTRWFTSDPVADINGSGRVDLTDYSIQKANWFLVGDLE